MNLFIFLLFSVVVHADDFPFSYEDSRAQFVALCLEARKTPQDYCEKFKVPSARDADLTIDYGYFSRPGNAGLVVLQSGIHGPESYAGAAVQKLFLRKYLTTYLEHGVDVLLIHALNPYGFKYATRADEDNINLNRNFSSDGLIYQVHNEGYVRMRDMFEPQGPVNSVWWSSLMSHVRIATKFISLMFHSREIYQAMNSGQFESPKGLSYGGHKGQIQHLFLQKLLPPLFAAHSGAILFLDFHTGLGQAGTLQILNGLDPDAKLLKAVHARVDALHTEKIEMVDASDRSHPDYYTTYGDVTDFAVKLGPQPNRILGLTMEYGTMPLNILGKLRSASRMILHNQAHAFGCSTPEVCAEVDQNFLEMFNPLDPVWRQKVVSKADQVFSVLVNWFSV